MFIRIGQSYERHAITHWLASHGTSPMMGLRLAKRAVVANLLVARMARCLRGGQAGDDHSEASSPNPQEDPPVAARVLLAAAIQCDRAACLDLLARGVPDINAKTTLAQSVALRDRLIQMDWHEGPDDTFSECTVLDISSLLCWEDVCQAILAAPGFSAPLFCPIFSPYLFFEIAHLFSNNKITSEQVKADKTYRML
jgi:hypothetical protein